LLDCLRPCGRVNAKRETSKAKHQTGALWTADL